MKKILILILSLISYFNTFAQEGNTFFTWKQYSEKWEEELLEAYDFYKKIEANEFPEYALGHIIFIFNSDTKEKLEKLSTRLSEFNCSSLEISEGYTSGFKLSGQTERFPITKDNVIFWHLAFYKEGYAFDSELAHYGISTKKEKLEFLNYSADKEKAYYQKAVEAYKEGNLFGAIVNWNNSLKVNQKDYFSYYDLGYAKNELGMFKDAMKDFDKSIEINPKYYSAIVARGTLSDENKEYDIAITYYNRAVALEPTNPQAYFNKGNTYFNKNDRKEACLLWNKAKELGAKYAAERIKEVCN
ncbi:MAG: tetratricopeptide repeat protein [Bacteroidia bacterium]|nr:tetratricopeptide repeat protein [Bacteroidia bacterium]